MNPIAIYCKSYREDVARAKVLLDSVFKFNNDNIPFYISVPQSDVEIFKNTLATTGYTLLTDEEIYNHTNTQRSWVTQQIVKSSFWKLGLCKNYLCIDSDSYFIRPFFIKDFIVEGTIDTPYTVMHEQKELFNWTCNKTSQLGFDPIDSFKDCRKKIMDLFDRKGRYYDFGPSPVIWSSEVWKSLEVNYMVPNKLTFEDLIVSVQSEFTWYGEWLLIDKTIPIYPCEPIFKVFHYHQQYNEAKHTHYKEEDFARLYMGIVMQSNQSLPHRY